MGIYLACIITLTALDLWEWCSNEMNMKLSVLPCAITVSRERATQTQGNPTLENVNSHNQFCPKAGISKHRAFKNVVFFFPPPSIEVNCSMKFKKKFRMCSITVVKCLLSITWWHREKKVSIVHWVLKKRVQEFKNFTHDAVVLFKKICKRRHMVI